MAETPSIMMLFWLWPPRRMPSPLAPPEVTPGVNCVRLVKLPRAIGRFSICSVVTANERSALCDWTSAASAVTTTVSAAPPTSRVSAVTATRSPPLTWTPERLIVLKPSIVTSRV